MIGQFMRFLGPARARALFGVIAGTGLLSLILNVVESNETIRFIQSLLLVIAVLGSAVIIGGRLDGETRARWLALLLPSVGAILLGVTLLPQFLLPLAGAALGWIVAGLFIFRSRAPSELQRAVKHLRKSDYAEAVKEIDILIKLEPENPNHYRFRAEVLRVWGKFDRARRDYQKMVQLDADSAAAHNGLAELSLQMGDYAAAHESAQRAAELAPQDWVALYNLGMIEDRLGQPNQVVRHLEAALLLGVKDTRHRALIHFYLLRAHSQIGDLTAAKTALDALKRHRAGIEEWEKILESDQAETLRRVLGADIEQAAELLNGQRTLEQMAEGAQP
jgi:tetratricopeptide (TPR) repeat protein